MRIFFAFQHMLECFIVKIDGKFEKEINVEKFKE